MVSSAEICLRRRRIAGRVVVDQDQGAGVQHQCPLDHLARIDRDVIDRADAHTFVRNQPVLAVEIEDVETLHFTANCESAVVHHGLPRRQDRVAFDVARQDLARSENGRLFLCG